MRKVGGAKGVKRLYYCMILWRKRGMGSGGEL